MPFIPTFEVSTGLPPLMVVHDAGSLLLLTAMYTCSPSTSVSPVNYRFADVLAEDTG